MRHSNPEKMGSYKMCVFFTRKFRDTQILYPSDIKQAFRAFSRGFDHLTAPQLQRFLVEFQGETHATVNYAEWIIDQMRRLRPVLTFDDFFHYLFCDDLNAPIISQGSIVQWHFESGYLLNETRQHVNHDMTAPLSHYYIFTGHNSYLTGNQLSSDCSDVPIVKALRRGVRAIELDMWPNSTKDDIDILHGRTLTAPVQLIKCLRSIKKHAFIASPYPVIITLEDHLTPSLQAKAAEMLIETFGQMLFYPEADGLAELPSPEALKYRIIISTKAPKEYLEAKIRKVRRKHSCKEKDILDEEDEWGADAQDFEPDSDTDDKNGSDREDDDLDDEKYHRKAASHYKRLIAIRAGKRKGKIKESLELDNDEVQRLSLSEQELAKATVSHGIDLVRFTQRNLLRIYPKCTRVDSSNYNPLIAWAHGAQMVAFNMQGYGKSLWVMHGFFRANGGCGYVKKPDFLVEDDLNNMAFNPSAKLPIKIKLNVRVYMGDGWRLDFSKTHFDAYSPPDFYIKVGIAGVPADSIMKKTQVIEDEWCPVWDEEFTFPLTVPELAMLRIEVREYDRSDKDDFAGQTCFPILELRSGIRAIPIFDRKGEKYKSVKLLMRFEFF